MALSVGVNSFVSVEDANSFLSDRLDADTWTASGNTQKEQSLVTASNLLSELSWAGIANDNSQQLAFPRVGSYFDPKAGTAVELVGIPDRIKQATYLLALHLLENSGILSDTGSAASITIDTIRLDRVVAPAKIPNSVKRLINPLLSNGGANLWWRAN